MAAAMAVLAAAGCGKPPELTREQIRALIESSEAFQARIDPGVVFMDTKFQNTAGMKREFLQLRGVALKEDGPWGMAGATTTVAFTWRWNAGPYAGVTFTSKARLNSTGKAWRVYDDYLTEQLSRAERGED